MENLHTEVVVASLPKCDFCVKEGKETDAAYDGRMASGRWANMCAEHYKIYGVGLGLGRGQRLIVKEND